MQSEILAHKEWQGFPDELHEGVCQQVVTIGYGASEDVESSCSGDRLAGRRQMAAAAGKKVRHLFLCSWFRGFEVEALYNVYPILGRRRTGKGHIE